MSIEGICFSVILHNKTVQCLTLFNLDLKKREDVSLCTIGFLKAIQNESEELVAMLPEEKPSKVGLACIANGDLP